jgi:hypothetical protein
VGSRESPLYRRQNEPEHPMTEYLMIVVIAICVVVVAYAAVYGV